MIEPIKPEDVNEVKASKLPDEVIQIFNDLIVAKWNGTSAVIKREDAISRIQAAMNPIERAEIFDRKLLDVEYTFRKAGWIVDYQSPDWDEDYEPYYTFSKAKLKEG